MEFTHFGGRDLITSAHLLSLAVHPADGKPAVPWGISGLQDPDVEEGQGILSPAEFGFLAGAIGRQVWATLELALGLSLDRAANELFYASLL